MEKSIHSGRYKAFLHLLRTIREERAISQVMLADRLCTTQSFVSKCERGERRLDVIELQQWCEAVGIPLSDFVRSFIASQDHTDI